MDDIANCRSGDRLWFYDEGDDGDAYAFALDRRHDGECAVLRRDGFTGDEEQVAESFAGFLTVRTALHLGLGDGPNPSVAALWRWTPGALLPNGVHLYGPQAISERNTTYQLSRYAPHWVLVGDDSAGNGLLMRRHGRDRTSLHRLDLGALTDNDAVEADGTHLTDDLMTWLHTGAPLPAP